MPYPVLPEDFAGRAALLQRIGDVIKGPWNIIQQGENMARPILPSGTPGGMAPPAPVIPIGPRSLQRQADEFVNTYKGPEPTTTPTTPEQNAFARAVQDRVQAHARQAEVDKSVGTPLSQMMREEPMWTKWGQGMGIPVDRLLKAVPALRQSWNLSDNEIKYYFTLMKQRGEL